MSKYVLSCPLFGWLKVNLVYILCCNDFQNEGFAPVLLQSRLLIIRISTITIVALIRRTFEALVELFNIHFLFNLWHKRNWHVSFLAIQVLIKDWKFVWYQTDLHYWRFIWLFLLRLEVGLCFSKSDRLPPKMAEIRLILRLNVIMEANLIIRLVSDMIIRWVSNLNIRQAADLIIRYHGGWSVYVF